MTFGACIYKLTTMLYNSCLRHIWFDKAQFRNGFDAIRERDVLLYYPYHTFEHVLELLRQASFGHDVGKSLYEADLVDEAKRLLTTCNIPVPSDVRVATEFSETAPATLKSVNDVKADEQILDIGDASAQELAEILKNAKTILWNGPVGVFEFPNFRKGTEIVANAIADSEAFSIAGGGDTLAAIDLFGIADKISYISTGGGAFLEFVEGKVLPAVAMLEERAKK